MGEVGHRYGDNYHILSDPFLSSLLATLCSKKTEQPLITDLIKILYHALLCRVVGLEFPCKKNTIQTRMSKFHKEAVLQAPLMDFNTKVVTVNLARAGIVPSQLSYEFFNHIFKPKYVRQDHIYINRVTDAKDHVVGSQISGYKIGGSIHNAMVLFPDPMGATGGSICATLNLYKKNGLPLI